MMTSYYVVIAYKFLKTDEVSYRLSKIKKIIRVQSRRGQNFPPPPSGLHRIKGVIHTYEIHAHWTPWIILLVHRHLDCYVFFKVRCKLTQRKCRQVHLVHIINRFDFHLSSFNRVVITLPVVPIHTVSISWVVPLKIAAVKVGVVTALVPPASLESQCTIPVRIVVVSIFCAELHATMNGKGITSCSWENTQDRREAS